MNCKMSVLQTTGVAPLSRTRTSFLPAHSRQCARRQNRLAVLQTRAEKDSYEKIEAPVREPVNPMVKDRQSEFDQVLKSDKLNPDREILGTEVGVADAMRFQGALPEVVNSRLAMLGFALACLGFRATGKNVWEQFKSAPGPIAAVFLLIIVASVVPVVRGAERREFLFFKPGAEVYLGRLAMLGFVGLLWLPFLNGYMLY